jgi:hypothetical protein
VRTGPAKVTVYAPLVNVANQLFLESLLT